MAQAQAARRAGVNVFDETRPMWQLFAVFLVPLILSNILQSASSLISSIYLGRLIGVHALAAVSSIFPLLFFCISFLIGLSNGSTVLIGQAFGARDFHTMKKVAGTTLGASFWIAIIVGAVCVFFAQDVLRWIATPADILHDSTVYAQWIFASAPVFFLYLVYTTFLRGTGDSQTPFYFLIVSTSIALVVTPALIRGWIGLPQLGIEAAAASFVISQLIGFIGLLTYLKVKRHPLQMDLETLGDAVKIDWAVLWRVVKIGVPTALQIVMVSLAEIAVLSFVNRFGSSATAAYGAVNQVVSYVQFPAISISIAASIFGAQCIGARREDKLASVVHSAVGLNYLIGGTIIAVCYIFAWNILGWFITAPSTLGIAHGLLMITLWSYLLFGNSAVISGVMRASGYVVWPTFNGIFAIWAIEVPAAYILMHYYGLTGVWMGYPIAFMVVLLMQTALYTFVWKKRTHARLI
ncbi:MAG: MATE family efflux transporter [Candidatus Eremiobacteraeota bacterium]|nr:MATE family efflux transporter [Candidatus Eremiobacteraeota bacterium]